MKITGLALGLVLTSAFHLCAQITVEVALKQDQFLPGEDLPAEVRITNRSGQTLQLGNDQAWLAFSVESRDDHIVLKTGEVPVKGAFTLQSSMRAIKTVNLEPYFNLAKPGRYEIFATVTIEAWNRQYTSDPKSFDIIQGANLWEQEVGVPLPPGETNRAPELRTYTLQQANYLKQLMLYCRLTDRTGKVYRIFPIGPMLSFGQPEPQVDKFSNLHVLYQDGPRSFNYTVIDTDGKVIRRQTYMYTPSRPRLAVGQDGMIEVVGGTRRVTSRDIPPPRMAEDRTPAPER